MAKDKLATLADELEMNLYQQEELQAIMKPLQEKEEIIRSEMVSGLLKKGLKFVRTSSGLGFGMVDGRVSYKVIKGREHEALDWAIKEFPGVLSIAAGKLNSVVQPMLNPPEFIERTQGEPHLAVQNQ